MFAFGNPKVSLHRSFFSFFSVCLVCRFWGLVFQLWCGLLCFIDFGGACGVFKGFGALFMILLRTFFVRFLMVHPMECDVFWNQKHSTRLVNNSSGPTSMFLAIA